MNDFSVTEIAEAMRTAEFPPRFDADESRLLIKLLQLVAEGNPVTQSQVEQTAASLQMPLKVVATFIETVSECDEEGNIVGVLGLSQRKHPHQFIVNGRVLSTWCAWDALFLPALLGKTAEVESRCPATKTRIYARITPDRVETVQPSEAVVSIALPQVTDKTLDSTKIRNTFCCHVHFFVSQEPAAEWILARSHDLKVLSIEDGYELGRLMFENVLESAKRPEVL